MESNFPEKIEYLLMELEARKELKMHLKLVHQTAFELLNQIESTWPQCTIDIYLVLFGAATHDIGKVLVTTELERPGKRHEQLGEKLLLERGFTKPKSRFACTHGLENLKELMLEDLLVIAADKLWKGIRIATLEELITTAIAGQLKEDYWDVYLKLDSIFSKVALGADERIYEQGP